MNPTLQKTLRFSDLIMDKVNRTNRYRLDASGKGINTTRVLTQLGKPCRHLTQLGGMFRPMFLRLCEKDGLSVSWVESDRNLRFCHTLINDADKSVTELVEESEPVPPETESRLREAFERLLPDCRWLIISGTKAPGFSDELVPFFVKTAKAKGKQIILDLRGEDLKNSLIYEPEVIKPNLLEFAGTFAPELVQGNQVMPDPEGLIEKICADLAERYGCQIILTDGAKPVRFTEEGTIRLYPFAPVPPVNTTGSGDAFTAGLAAGLDDSKPLRDAIAQGIHCGALNAGLLKVGVIR
ncbi:MAG: PfkB family carbohydrate kinase [Spirochaetaceae bacterium]|jgi:fructose-1-phosphate kinase PfkB-like protein|nr:PfkB family carbohydrate kinase [Spirochaetaceae bacterium]